MAKEQSTKKGAAKKEAASNVSYDQVLEVAAKLKSAFETKSSKDIAGLLSSSAIWLSNKPSDVKNLIESLDKLTANSTDIEFSLTKLENTEVTEDEVGIEAEAQLVWTNDETWEENEATFKLNLGVAKKEDSWAIKYLGISPAVKLPGPATFQTPSDEPYFGSAFLTAQNAPYFAADAFGSSYFADAVASPYFSESALGGHDFPPKAAGQGSKAEIPSLVPIYMPVLVPSSFLKKLFE